MSTPVEKKLPTFSDVQTAARRLRGLAYKTPVLTSRQLNELAGAELFFKCEPFQRVGAFKFRGAANAVFALDEAVVQRGILTHSSGNHGQAVALAAKLRGVKATVVMPKSSAAVKIHAVQSYRAEIVFCEPSTADRESVAAQLIHATGAALIHPYDDPMVIAGQGTACLELAETHPDLDAVITPVGGGGLLSGTSLAAKELLPKARIYGAEPAGANDAAESLAQGRKVRLTEVDTVADGLRSQALGDLTFAMLKSAVNQILVVDDRATLKAMRLVWERLKVVIEPSSAVPVAAVFGHPEMFAGKRVGIILSGGNVDWDNVKDFL